MSKICSVTGCEKPVVARGWCEMHYCRWKRHGHPLSRHKVGNEEALEFIRDVVLNHTGDECLKWPFHRVKTRDGRFYAATHVDGRQVLVSRYVCEKVHGPAPSPTHHAAHSCGKGHEACVAPAHLQWKTPAENQADRVAHGTHDRGERSANSKLSEADVRLIRSNPDRLTQATLAQRFGICRTNVSMIQSGKRWSWISG